MSSKLPLRAAVGGGRLVIEIGIDTLKFCAENWPAPPVRVLDMEQFAFDVCRALNDESETGETLVTRMLDDAMEKAINDGAISVEEIGGGDE